jgi:hypothetical protein
MKKISLLFLSFLFCFFCFSQSSDPAVRFASTINTQGLQKDLTIIAGPSMEGRETGTEGQRKAAAYIELRMKEMGLTPAKSLGGYQQTFPLFKDSLISSSLSINSINGVYGTDFITSVTQNENGIFSSGTIVFAGYGIKDTQYDDYAELDVKGKIVLFFQGEPKEEGKYILSGTTKASSWTYPGISKKLELAKKLGAIGALIINPIQSLFTERAIENSKKTNLYFPEATESKKLNYAMLSHGFVRNLFPAEADLLINTAKKYKTFIASQMFSKQMKTTIKFKKDRNNTLASNVIGILEGTDLKDECIVLSGHYDHLGMHDGQIYYGADDDGSGTVAVLQMAEAFIKAKAAGKGPRRSIIFLTVSGEEKGLWGSEYYTDHPIFPLDKTSADLNTDMIGRIDTERKLADTLNYIYVIGHDKISTELGELNIEVNKKNTQLVLDYKFDDPDDINRIFFRSDHYNFARKDVPVLFFYDGMLQGDYHKPTDTVDKINWQLYQKRVQMIFHTAWAVANKDKLLKRDLPIPTMTR